jgi:hypothetical protein
VKCAGYEQEIPAPPARFMAVGVHGIPNTILVRMRRAEPVGALARPTKSNPRDALIEGDQRRALGAGSTRGPAKETPCQSCNPGRALNLSLKAWICPAV